jgi:hypothetical protein
MRVCSDWDFDVGKKQLQVAWGTMSHPGSTMFPAEVAGTPNNRPLKPSLIHSRINFYIHVEGWREKPTHVGCYMSVVARILGLDAQKFSGRIESICP